MELSEMNVSVPLDRRRFLTSTAAGVLTAATGAVLGSGCRSVQTGAKSERKVIVGAHPWVYAATQPNYDIYPVLDRIFADMSYAGLDGIELMHTALRYDDAVERIGALSDEYDLPVIGTSFGGAMWDRAQHDAVYEDARTVVTRLAALGGRTLGTSVGGASQPKTQAQLDAQAELLRRIMALCQDNDVELNLHNHTYEVENSMHDLRGTLARIPEARLGPDLNWLVRGGVDPVDFIETFGDRIVFLHIRDQNADGTWSEAVGEGDMDYVAIGRALHEAGFSGDAVIELAHERNFKPTRPLRESLRMSRACVKQTLGY
ncbi:MAG: sugar phosphate isomerase/epimerase [Sedimentisphaerales bacterium]|nr:sugar phosphate isomerase/epimerase [Sedimentisphaerales bacterium]